MKITEKLIATASRYNRKHSKPCNFLVMPFEHVEELQKEWEPYERYQPANRNWRLFPQLLADGDMRLHGWAIYLGKRFGAGVEYDED